MKRHLAWCVLLAGGVAGPLAAQESMPSAAGPSAATPSAAARTQVAATLATAANTSTWGHPDQFNELAGMHYFYEGKYAAALKYFRIAARYADKPAQLALGLMYLHGQGVARDPATGYAWIALAAERGYPQFLATRNATWSSMNATERQRAGAIEAGLAAEYGDVVAKPRMARELRIGLSQMTGSLTGGDGPFLSVLSPGLFNLQGGEAPFAGVPSCSGASIEGTAVAGCSNFYASWRWQPREYFKNRDAVWFGKVTVQPLQPASGPQVH